MISVSLPCFGAFGAGVASARAVFTGTGGGETVVGALSLQAARRKTIPATGSMKSEACTGAKYQPGGPRCKAIVRGDEKAPISRVANGIPPASTGGIARFKFISILLLALASLAPAVEIRVASYNIGAHFVGSAPDYSLGDPGTPDHDSVRDILDRIDADVVALEEIASADVSGTTSDLDVLAASLGYPYVHVALNNGTAGHTAPFDTTLRVAFLSRYPFINAGNITSPPDAREMARFHAVVKVDVPGTTNDPVLIASHLKSGSDLADRFRRVVEMKRLTGYLASQGLTNNDNFVIMGDFNLSSTNRTFDTLPSGLPVSYDLGADVVLPINYSTNPLAYFSTPGVSRLDPRQVNGSAVTFPSSGSTIDLFLVSPAIAGRQHGTEIYNSALDSSNGTGLVKSGSPLPSGTSSTASDHLTIFGDFELDADLPDLNLALSMPVVLEGMPDGTVMATVTLPALLPQAVNVVFSSDDLEAALPLPPVLQIPAGTLSGSVAIRTPRNYLVDEQRSVTLTATVVGHDPAHAVLQVENSDGPYILSAPGDTVTETFTGFDGSHDPAPWTSSGGHPWLGVDNGSSSVAGFRAYGPATDPSLGFLPAGDGTTLAATFTNGSDVPLKALQIAFDVEQWRSALGGSAHTLSAELFYSGTTVPLPGLAYAASQSLPAGPVAGGATTPLSTTANGLAVPPGASFELRIHLTPGAGQGVPPSDVFVNEIHYDNTSTDAGEFVEIAVGPGFTGPLSSVSLVLYNGSTGATYGSTHTLSTFAAGATTASGYRLFSKAISGLQNDTDGMAVVVNGAVLHFISYEGSFIATNGAADGLGSTDIGVEQTPVPEAGVSSIGLAGTAGEASAFTWTYFNASTPYSPGQPNAGQIFTVPAPPSQGIAIDNLSVTFLADSAPDNDGDGIADSLDPDDDNDGQMDADEVAFGTDPFDSTSIFKTSLSRAGAAPNGLELSFPGASGITYTVQYSINLTAWETLSTHVGSGQAIVVPLPEEEERMYFRVRAGE